MTSQTDILAVLALILVGGTLAGHASQRLGLPTPVGKITIGLLIGPAALGLVSSDNSLDALSSIGVILLMFMAGLETDTATMRRVSVPAFAVALGGALLPFIGGLALGYAFHLGRAETLFLGAILTATSVSITAQTLRELGRLQSREGTTILAAAVIDDILGIVILAFVFAATGGGDPVLALAKMALFLPIALLLGKGVLTPIMERVGNRFSGELQLSMIISVALAYAWAADRLGGVAAVTGAYMAGLLVAETQFARVSHGLNWVMYGFFVPLFFVGIGLKADLASIGEAPYLVLALLAVAIVGKVAGCYAGARLCRLNGSEALRVGVGMMSRGEIALVIAAAGLAQGAIGNTVFSASILMALVTTVLTPILLKITYATDRSASRVDSGAELGPAGAPAPAVALAVERPVGG
jgi:Kef-type K+ transport system membrane component KefB